MDIYQLEPKNVQGFKLAMSTEDGFSYINKTMGLVVIQSMSKELDGKVWIHTSYSRKSRIPTYQDTVFIKKHFIGDDNKAVMVFPETKEHVNIHDNCLHLFHCLDPNPLPDFTRGTGSI